MTDSAVNLLQLLESQGDTSSTIHLKQRLRDDKSFRDELWAAASIYKKYPDYLLRCILTDEGPELIERYSNCEDLELASSILPEIAHPRQPYGATISAALDGMAARMPLDAKAGDVARLLIETWGFGGDHRSYHTPSNSFMPDVLSNRLGLPITLTVLWMLVCKRLDLVAEAIVLPGHILGAWDGGWVDLFHRQSSMNLVDLKRLAYKHGIEDVTSILQPISHKELRKRMARNLIKSYSEIADGQRVRLALHMSL